MLYSVSSSRRTYHLDMTPKVYQRTMDHLFRLSPEGLQNFIDENFEKSSKLGTSRSSGAWGEGKLFRDKAKMAIVIKEGLLDADHPDMRDFWEQEGRLAGSMGF